MIRDLLSEAHPGGQARGDSLAIPVGAGVTAAASDVPVSPETYVGYGRQEDFASREPVRHDVAAQYSTPAALDVDQWALGGRWVVSEENAVSQSAGSSITYRFQGRDLHLVLGSQGIKPVRFRITLDGAAPGADHGTDIDAQGNGVIRKQRLYQLIRQNGTIRPRTFRIEFLDPGAAAFAFTFG
jgi:hypothetical protein